MEGTSRKIPWMDQGYNSGNDQSPYSTSSPFFSGQKIDRMFKSNFK